jgi:hypothetical protein
MYPRSMGNLVTVSKWEACVSIDYMMTRQRRILKGHPLKSYKRVNGGKIDHFGHPDKPRRMRMDQNISRYNVDFGNIPA